MKKLTVVALAVGVLTASCSGHGTGSMLPNAGTAAQTPQSGARGTGTAILPAATVAVPQGWASTGTQALSLANAADLGVLNPAQSLTVRVGLQIRNVSQLQSLVASGQQIDSGTFMAQYAPTAAQATQVTQYLQSQGLSGISVEPNNLLISATGTATTIQKAFNTTLHSFSQNGATVFANVSPAYVPAALSGVAIAVLGLNNAATMKAAPITQCYFSSTLPGSAPCARLDYNPSTFWVTYDVGTTPTGAKSTIAVMAEGNVSSVISDLRVAESNFGLPRVPVSVVQVGLASPDTSGIDEWDLDTQSSTGIAGNIKQLYIYATTSLTDSDIA